MVGPNSIAQVRILGSGPVLPINAVAADRTLTTQDYTLLANASGANRVLTLPDSTAHPGRIYIVKRTDTVGGNTLTVAAAGTDLIDGAATILIGTLESRVLQSDGNGNWYILASF